MKTMKFNVTIVRESPITEIMDKRMAKEILMSVTQLKMSPFEQPIRSEMKIDKERLSLKSGRKWFNKYKNFKISQIQRFYQFDNCPEYVLIYVCVDEFSGVIVLKIEIASHMIEFTERLKTVVTYTEPIETEPEVVTNGDVDRPVEERQSFDTVVINESKLLNGEYFNGDLQKEDERRSFEEVIMQTDSHSMTTFSGNDASHDSVDFGRRRFIVVDPSLCDELSYVNGNTKEVLVEVGPVSLYSKTYPSVYNRNDDSQPDYYETIESDHESTNEEVGLF